AGRLWGRMIVWGSSTAASASSTRAIGLQLVERDRLACSGLGEAELCALVRTGDAVEQLHDVAGIRVRLVDRARQQRPRHGARLDVQPVCKAGELLGLLVVEGDVQPLHGVTWYTQRYVPCRHHF